MSLKVERFINQLMTSNCYIVVDVASNHCLCVDPASEKSEREIEFIHLNGLTLDYIILTHEHTDHTWGVNSLTKNFPDAKVICSAVCKDNLPKGSQAYFRYYYNNRNYNYTVNRVDIITEEINNKLLWFGHQIVFINTPGHSMGSICMDIDGLLFTGDTIMQVKPFINKRNGSKELYYQSLKKLLELYPTETIIYPGHGEVFQLNDYNQ